VRRFLILALLLALGCVGSASARPAGRLTAVHHHRGCRTYVCDRRIDRVWAAWQARRAARERRLMATATASWYDDSGGTASGFHAALGFAHLGPGEGAYPGMAFRTRVLFCAVRCATGEMDDHGPYIAGREFDLGPALKAAIGASDLGTVRYRIVR
jgi:hypothetical protein